MNRDLTKATLALAGWVPIRNRTRGLYSWGISHAEYGTIKEDAWHKEHGPSLAPLAMFPLPEHVHQPEHECAWASIDKLSLERLYQRAIERGWLNGS